MSLLKHHAAVGKEIIVGIDYIISTVRTESVFDSLHAIVMGTNVIVGS
jgi:hypothetical protein